MLVSYESLYHLAYSYVKNESDAMDVVQESAYKAIKNAGSLKRKDYIRTWLFRIVINTSCYFEDRKLQEIADVLEKNLSTTKSILYRSLKKLKVKLTEGEFCYES